MMIRNSDLSAAQLAESAVQTVKKEEDPDVLKKVTAMQESWSAAAREHCSAASSRAQKEINETRQNLLQREMEQARWIDFVNTVLTDDRAGVRHTWNYVAGEAARQIAALRRQWKHGEADKLLMITQAYLRQLALLERWAAENRVSKEELRTLLEQWATAYGMETQEMLDAENAVA